MRRARGLTLGKLLKLGSIVFVIFCVFVLGFFYYFAKDLPQPGRLTAREISQSTKIFDRNGRLLYDIYGEQDRTYVKLTDIADYLKKGTIAVEDKDFYKHEGFSVSGYLRVIRDAILYHSFTGGSTLTQQLIKNVFLSPERTLPRKIKEFILAIQVEQKYSKDGILELYLNEAPYGGTALGIEAASEQYFNKQAKDLNLVQSAILAGMPQAPSYYSPYSSDSKAYIARAQHVLDRMREDGYITKQQTEEAKKALPNVAFQSKKQTIKAPHFVFFVKKILEDQFGSDVVENGGLQVTTSLDLDLQEKAQQIVQDEVAKAKNLKVSNGASMVMNTKNGDILAMVGSKDYFSEDIDANGNQYAAFNVVTQGLRQPGSSIKPVTYATALKKGYTASSLLMDTQTVFHIDGVDKDYVPENYDGKFRGPVQVRFALGNSLNIPAVKMVARVGVKEMLTTADDLGLHTLAPTEEHLKRFGLSITLGGGEVHLYDLVSAYTAFSNGGYRTEPVAILKVTDAKGKVLFEKRQIQRKQAIDPGIAFIISHILLDNNARSMTFGSNSLLNIPGKTVSVKTGTTDDKRDNWTVGWTPSFIVGTWVGNNDNSPMNPALASGVTGAAPIWNKLFKELLKDKKDEQFPIPSNVNAIEIDALGGGKPVDNQPKRTEYFIKGTEPQSPSPIYQKIDGKDYIIFTEDDPVSTDGKNRWQEGINQWIESAHKDDSLYHPPGGKSGSSSSSTSDEISISFNTPHDNDRINNNDIDFDISASAGSKQIVLLRMFTDDKEKKAWESSTIKEKVNIQDGSHTIKIRARDDSGREAEKSIKIGVNANP